jgi:hypothetical protein
VIRLRLTNNEVKKKLFWSVLLFIDVVLFIEALSTNNIGACLLVMGLSELIYFKGNQSLFGKFDAKRKAKRAQYRKEMLKARNANRHNQ